MNRLDLNVRTLFGDVAVGLLLAMLLLFAFSGRVSAQQNAHHLMVGVGASYQRGFDATLSYQRTNRYHNAWEFFGQYHIKYEPDPLAGHITKHSFWHSYNSWHLGVGYKPCVARGRNHHGNMRIGVSVGSDLTDFVGGIHLGYEHSIALHKGWEFFFRVNEDVIIPKSSDLFRTGVHLGFKVPLNAY